MGYGIIIKGELYLNRWTKSDIEEINEKISNLKDFINIDKQKLLLMIGNGNIDNWDKDTYNDQFDFLNSIFIDLWDNIQSNLLELGKLYIVKDIIEENHKIIEDQ